MKIEIQEVFFSEDELFDWSLDKKYDPEYKNLDGEKPDKAIRLFTRNEPCKEILIPLFKIDKNGNAIGRRQEKEMKSVKPDLVKLLVHISSCIKATIEEKPSYYSAKVDGMKRETIYVYVCYREDVTNYVGICAYNFPLYKTLE